MAQYRIQEIKHPTPHDGSFSFLQASSEVAVCVLEGDIEVLW